MSIIVNPPKNHSMGEPSLPHQDLLALSGSALITRILDHERPGSLVRGLHPADFFWVIKQIRDEECLPVLELASDEQWEHLLDLEIWRRDSLDARKTLLWLKRLAEADPDRLAAWLFAEAEEFFSLLMLKTAEVVARDEEADGKPLTHHFTLDERFYIRPYQEKDREILEKLLRILAQADYEQYHGLLYGLATVISAEAEENLYRFRNARLADIGFEPFEEANAVYAPLTPAALGIDATTIPPRIDRESVDGQLIPLSPLGRIKQNGIFGKALAGMADPDLKDRIYFEFSALSNRIISADGFPETVDVKILAEYCRRAWSYVNVALECLCGNDAHLAEEHLSRHPLNSLFRVGYGYALDLQNETRSWRQNSWFIRQGRSNDFWGSPWAEIMEGLLATRPRYFKTVGKGSAYRDFSTARDLENVRRQIRQIRAVDAILARLTTDDEHDGALPAAMTFHPLLFNRWLRRVLGRRPSAAVVSLADLKRFFLKVRGNDARPPFSMPEYGELFIADFMEGAEGFEEAEKRSLREALGAIWMDFRKEYENVSVNDLDERHIRFFLIAENHPS